MCLGAGGQNAARPPARWTLKSVLVRHRRWEGSVMVTSLMPTGRPSPCLVCGPASEGPWVLRSPPCGAGCGAGPRFEPGDAAQVLSPVCRLAAFLSDGTSVMGTRVCALGCSAVVGTAGAPGSHLIGPPGCCLLVSTVGGPGVEPHGNTFLSSLRPSLLRDLEHVA